MSDYADKEQDDPVEKVPEAKRKKGNGARKFKFQYDFEDGLPNEQQELSNNTFDPDHQIQRKAFNDQRPQQQSSLQLKAMVNQSPQAQQALQFKTMMDRSPQATQALQLKERLDNSPRTKEALHTQQMIHNSPRAVAQRNYLGQFGEKPREKKEQQFPSRPVQMKAKTCSFGNGTEQAKDNNQVQFDAGSSAMDTASIHKTAQKGVEGKGGKLPHLGKIQKSFGKHNVTQAQAYTGPKAASAAKNMGAEAYTTRNKVAFAKSNPSLHTTAHEAAHLIQQGSGIKLKGGVGQKGDPYERHADAVADRVVQGKSAESLLNQFSHPGGVHQKASESAVQNQESGNIFTDNVAPVQCMGHRSYLTNNALVQFQDEQMDDLNTLMANNAYYTLSNQSYPGHTIAPRNTQPGTGALYGSANIITAGEHLDLSKNNSHPGTPTNMGHYSSGARWHRTGGLVHDVSRTSKDQAATRMHALNHKLHPALLNNVADNIFLGTATSNTRHRNRVEAQVEATFRPPNQPATQQNTAYEAALAAAIHVNERTNNTPMLYWSNTAFQNAWVNTAVKASELKGAKATSTNYGAGIALKPSDFLASDNQMGVATVANTFGTNYYHAWADYTVTPRYAGYPNYVKANYFYELSQLINNAHADPNVLSGTTAARGASAIETIVSMNTNDARDLIADLPDHDFRAAVLGNTDAAKTANVLGALIGQDRGMATAVMARLPLAILKNFVDRFSLNNKATIVNTLSANNAPNYAAHFITHIKNNDSAGDAETLLQAMIADNRGDATRVMIHLALADIEAIINAATSGANKAKILNTLSEKNAPDYAADILAYLRRNNAGNTATLLMAMIADDTDYATRVMVLLPLNEIKPIMDALNSYADKAKVVNVLSANNAPDYAMNVLVYIRYNNAANAATLLLAMFTNNTEDATHVMTALTLNELKPLHDAINSGADKARLVNVLSANNAAAYAAQYIAYLKGIHAGNTGTLLRGMVTNDGADATRVIILLSLGDMTTAINTLNATNSAAILDALIANNALNYVADLLANWAGTAANNAANALINMQDANRVSAVCLMPAANTATLTSQLSGTNQGALLNLLVTNNKQNYAADLVGYILNNTNVNTAFIPLSNSNNVSRAAVVSRFPMLDFTALYNFLDDPSKITILNILATNGAENYAANVINTLLSLHESATTNLFEQLNIAAQLNIYNLFQQSIRDKLINNGYAESVFADDVPNADLDNVIPNGLPSALHLAGAAPGNLPGSANPSSPNNVAPTNLKIVSKINLPGKALNNLQGNMPNNLPVGGSIPANDQAFNGPSPNETGYRLEKLATFPTWANRAFPTDFTANVKFYAAVYNKTTPYIEYEQQHTYSTDGT